MTKTNVSIKRSNQLFYLFLCLCLCFLATSCTWFFKQMIEGCGPSQEQINQWVKDKDVKSLINVLKVESCIMPSVAWMTQENVIQGIKRIGKPAVKPLITDGLSNDNPDIRMGAAEALGWIKDQDALVPLATALRDKSPEVRMEAAWALGWIGDDKMIEFLEPLLSDKDWRVRCNASISLLRLADAELLDKYTMDTIFLLKDKDVNNRRQALLALTRVEQEKLLKIEIEYEKTGVSPTEAKKTKFLDKMMVLVIDMLQDEDMLIKKTSLDFLNTSHDPKAIPALILLLNDKDQDIRYSAVIVLSNFNDDVVLETLIGKLKDEDLEMQVAAAEALGKIGDKRAVEPLLSLLKNTDKKDFSLVKGVVFALGEIKDARALDTIIHLAQNGELTKEQKRVTIVPGKAEFSKKQLSTKRYAADALGKIKNKKAVDVLIELLRDENEQIQIAAAYALGEIGEKKALKPLLTLFDKSGTEVRNTAFNAVKKIDRSVEIEKTDDMLGEDEGSRLAHVFDSNGEEIVEMLEKWQAKMFWK